MPITAFDYRADLRRYVKNPDEKAIKTIENFCGIALKGLDSRWVSVTDEKEIERVIKGFCTKKLKLDGKAARAVFMETAKQMAGDRTKHRLTFYYLLALKANALPRIS